MIMLMVMEFLFIPNNIVMKENGKWIYKKDLVKKYGLMAVFLKECSTWVKSTVEAYIIGQTDLHMMETGLII
jgi:hypothetical protein